MTRVLDRIPSKPDPRRTLDFNLADFIAGRPARSYTWRCDVVLDQGREGACVGHGWAHEAVARPVVVDTWPRPNFTAGNPQAFAFELYDWCRRNDEWLGEDYDGTSVAAGARGSKRAGLLEGYMWTDNADVLSVGVSRVGPAVLGIPMFTGMMNPDRDGFLQLTGVEEGGHCLLENGFSLNRLGRKAHKVHNSWGLDWGIRGEAWIEHDDMRQLLAHNGEACLPVRRKP